MKKPDGLSEDQIQTLDSIPSKTLLQYLESRASEAETAGESSQAIIEQIRDRLGDTSEKRKGSGKFANTGLLFTPCFRDGNKTAVRLKALENSGVYVADVMIQLFDGRMIHLDRSNFDSDRLEWLIDPIRPEEIFSITKSQRMRRDKKEE